METGRDNESVIVRLSGEKETINQNRQLRPVKDCVPYSGMCVFSAVATASTSKCEWQWCRTPNKSTTHADGRAVRWKGSWELLSPYSDFAVNGKLLKNKDVWKTSIDHIPGVAILQTVDIQFPSTDHRDAYLHQVYCLRIKSGVVHTASFLHSFIFWHAWSRGPYFWMCEMDSCSPSLPLCFLMLFSSLEQSTLCYPYCCYSL